MSIVSVVCCQVEISTTADRSSKRVLPTVVRRCVWFRDLKNEETMALALGRSAIKILYTGRIA